MPAKKTKTKAKAKPKATASKTESTTKAPARPTYERMDDGKVKPVRTPLEDFNRMAESMGQAPEMFAIKVVSNPNRWQEFLVEAKKIRAKKA